MLKKLIKKAFNFMGMELLNRASYDQFVTSFDLKNHEIVKLKDVLGRLNYMIAKNSIYNSEKLDLPGFLHESIGIIEKSKSQLFQDLFVLYCLNYKRNGFFIEFGATNGLSLSNTYLLEKDYEWKGILAEPARIWMKELKENRNVIIESKCVWSKSGEVLDFNETEVAELSTVDNFTNTDAHSDRRQKKKIYQVDTISLNDLLQKHNAPQVIDYLSVDTEGSEFEILNAFDFSKYKINIITVEHNRTPKREAIFELLTRKGYYRVFEEISLFDDWYVNAEIKPDNKV